MARWLKRLHAWFGQKTPPLGSQGESLAAHFLERQGYAVLGRNVHIGRYEVDIIARDRDTTVFVEVKTRSEDRFAPPDRNVNPVKRKKLTAAARRYIARENNPRMYYRFDVVAILLPPQGPARIAHYKDAFGSQHE